MPAATLIPTTSINDAALNIANIRKVVFDDIETENVATGLLSANPQMISLTNQTLDIADRLATSIADTPAAFPDFDLLIADMQTDLFLLVDASDQDVAIENASLDYLHRFRACVDLILVTFGLTV